MANAPNYNVTKDFSQAEADNEAGRSTVDTSALDNELANVASSVNQVNTNLQRIQRDDGEVRDQVIKSHALNTEVLALIASTWTPQGAWITATNYVVGDLVEEGTPGDAYVCVVAHTSGTFATDLSNGYWMRIRSATYSKLASTLSGEGASLIGVEDSAGNFLAGTKTVESILAELFDRRVAIGRNDYATMPYFFALHEPTSDHCYIQITNASTGNNTSDGFRIGLDAGENVEMRLWETNKQISIVTNQESLQIDDTAGNGGVRVGGGLTAQGSGTINAKGFYANDIPFAFGYETLYYKDNSPTHQSIPSGSYTPVDLHTAPAGYTNASLWYDGANPSRLTVPDPNAIIPAGPLITKVRITAHVKFDLVAGGERYLRLAKNGDYTFANLPFDIIAVELNPTAAAFTHLEFTTPVLLVNPLDYFEIVVLQNSGGPVTIFSGGCWMFIEPANP